MCKKLFCLVIFVFVLGLVGNASADLVAHYKFEGDTNDSSGYGHNGNAIGEPNYVAGKIGRPVGNNPANCRTSAPSRRVNNSCYFRF